MKNWRKSLSALAVLSFLTSYSVAQAEMSLEERVEELEIDKALRNIKFGGYLLMQYDGFDTDDGTSESGLNFHRMRAALDMSAKPFENVSFFSRITASKYVNSTTDLEGDTSGLGVERAERGEMMYLEKAYLDYKMNQYLVLSAGRFPTVDGVPINYKYGQAKMGTYPRLAYNTTLEGYALTYKVGKHFDQDLVFRAIYHPFSWPTVTSPKTVAQSRLNSEAVSSTTNMFTGMLDYNTGKTNWFDNLNFVVQYISAQDLAANDIVTAGGTATSTLNFGLDLTTIHVDADNIMNSNVSLSVSHYLSKVTNDGGIDFSSLFGAPAGSVSYGFGAGADESTNGAGTLIAVNYRTPWTLIVGAEYLTSNKDYLFFDTGSDNLTNFYGTRGTATHLWFTYPLENTLVLTIGYRNQDFSHELPLSYFGAPTESDTKITTAYASLRLDF